MFNIEQFHSEVNNRNGLQRTNKFQVLIPPPQILLGRLGTDNTFKQNTGLHFWCQDVQMPGYQIQNGNVRRHTYGPNEMRPFAPNFQQVQMNFVCDGDMFNWNYFSAWLQCILPHDSEGRGANEKSRFGLGNSYDLSYKQEYAVDFEIRLLDEAGNITLKLHLTEAFPSNMNAIPFAWGDSNNYATFSVFFEYLDWYVTKGEYTTGHFYDQRRPFTKTLPTDNFT